MNCKICGAPMQENAKTCRNCGSTLTEMGIAPPKAPAPVMKGNAGEEKFEKRAEYFGGVEVKERKANALAKMDMKLLSIILILMIFVIFILVRAYFETRTNTISVDDFTVTLPSSMRPVEDTSFDVRETMAHQEFANSRMEFTFAKYDANKIIPDLDSDDTALTNDYREIEKSVTAKSKLRNLDYTFIQELDDTFGRSFDDYKRISIDENRLDFTYHDQGSVDNYVEVMVIVKDTQVYQFTCMCTDTEQKKYDKKFDTIFSSINF